MTRRRTTLILTAAAALFAGGCSTFSDADSIARVNDVELDQDQLDEILPLVPPGATADVARSAISLWLDAQVVTQVLDDAGIEIDQATLDTTEETLAQQFGSFADLSDRTRDLLVSYVAGYDLQAELPTPADDDVAAWFDAGPSTSGLACVSHILVETEDEAETILAELDDAAADDEFGVFATLAAERSIDPGSGSNGGFLLCDRAQSIAQQFVPPFAQAALAATPGVPTEPIQSDFGYHVIRLQTFDESTLQLQPLLDSGLVQAQFAVDQADIHVASRYGTADGLNVVPLGT